ncbi:MAG: flagellar hook-basal body complex protein FliE, partial [Thermoplasmatales archaeon]|nr:flagellar hook-basal body complex protein FliE [Thermoplasmatales archaeon]
VRIAPPAFIYISGCCTKMRVIAFTGMPFSGKSEAVKIAKEMDIPVIRMGDMIWEEVKNRKLELSGKNVGTIASQMREEHGKDIWARRTLEKIKSVENMNFIVIDGIRNVEEIDLFKRYLEGNFVVVAVEASDETRQKRALIRNREDDSKDLQRIKERDKRELCWGLGKVIASADIVVLNEGSVEDFQKKIREILERL